MASEARNPVRSRLELDEAGPHEGASWSLFVAGDTIVQESTQESPFGSDLAHRMQASDLAVLNLEGPVAGAGEPITKSGPSNRTVASTPDVLKEAGIDAVTLANNHIMDYGPAGLFETIDVCRASGLGYAGAGADPATALEPHRTQVAEGSIRIDIMSLCEREFGIATESDPGTAWVNEPNTLSRIEAAAAETDVLVVAVHGGIEYVPFPPTSVRERCESLVEAGADLVVGHHPHVPQGWEAINGVPVFYSLGNFLFDQTQRPNTHRGLALEVSFRGATPVAIDLIPTNLVGTGVRPLSAGDERAAFLDHLHRLSAATEEALEPHWQEVAERVFLQRHAHMIRKSAGGDPVEMLRHPLIHLRGGKLWEPTHRQHTMLALLNLVRNESHRDVIETALTLRTGVGDDERSPAVTSQVQQFFEETEDRPIYDPPSSLERGLRSTSRRIRQKLRELFAFSAKPG